MHLNSDKGAWMLRDDFIEQIVFDLRKSNIQDNIKQKTFKKELEIWEDKPIIVT